MSKLINSYKKEVEKYIEEIETYLKNNREYIKKIAERRGGNTTFEEVEKEFKTRARNLKKHLKEVEKFSELAEVNKLKVSKSPYSNSLYAHKKSEKITWGEKPEGSYRLANHWNWEDSENEDIIHCPTVSGKCYGYALCQVVKGKYKKI